MFSWDAQKALRNHQKHGVPFEEASTVFSDPEALDWEDLEHTAAERRYPLGRSCGGGKRLGLSTVGRVLLVIYTLRRLRNGIETIRIISSRPASRRERQAYAR